MNLPELQAAVKEWSDQNFGPSTPPHHRNLLGIMEELGEFADAHQAATEEEWRPVVGYDEYHTSHYEVSSFGRIRRTVGGKGT